MKNFLKSFIGDSKNAFFMSWIILSGIIFLIILSSFFAPPKVFDCVVPKCEWQLKYNKKCVFCGMTRGFLAISKGQLLKAVEFNKLSIPLYLGFIANDAVLIFYLFFKKIKITKIKGVK